MLVFINSTSQLAPTMRSPGHARQYENSVSTPSHKRGRDLSRSDRLRLNLLAQKSHLLFASRKTGGGQREEHDLFTGYGADVMV